MPAKAPPINDRSAVVARSIGQAVRERRLLHGVKVTTLAEAAGVSRVTVFRVEKGEPSVTLGAYLAVCDALDLVLSAGERESQAEPVLPLTILVSNYPQLQKLAWQIQPTEQLSPAEVFSIYERNWRHVDAESIIPEEQALIDALQAVFGDFNVSA